MKKRITILLAGMALLTAATVAQAHPRGYGVVHGSVSIAVPLGHHGYAVLGTAPYYYAAPYAPYRYDYGYRHGNRHGYGHGHRHESRHHRGHGRDSWKHGKRHGNSHHRDRDRDHGRGRHH